MSGLEGLLAGHLIGGRYRILEVVGRGGMGAVYRATDERLNRDVAVKVITVLGGADAEGRERIRARFRHEAAAAARLPHHPNVVPVYDYGTDDALGLDFLTMELLRGETLAARLLEGRPLPVADAVSVLLGAARGVAVGHRSGLVHRDVKPGNIFLMWGARDEEVQVRVLDFGIAKMITEEDTVTQLTQDGRAPLSPAYASPEQLRAEPKVQPASDVFSLGLVAFQALTGVRPFTDELRNRMTLSLPVSTPSIRPHNPKVPVSLANIVRKAMDPAPEQRYADAEALADALAVEADALGLDAGTAPLPPPPPARSALSETNATERPAADGDRTETLPSTTKETGVDDRTLVAPEPVKPEGAPASQKETTATNVPTRVAWAGRTVAALLVLFALGTGVWYALLRDDSNGIAAEPPPDLIDLDIDPIEEPVIEEPDELNAYVHNEEGIRFLSLDRTDEAVRQFQFAAGMSPDNLTYRTNLGLALLRQDSVDAAIRELDQVLRRSPAHTSAYVHLGDARLARGDTAIAVEAYRQFLARGTDERQIEDVERRLAEVRGARTGVPQDG